jgi:hypothetical protein
VAASLVALIGLTGCDRFNGTQKVGATIDARRGLPEVVAHPCPGQIVTQVSLWLMSKNGVNRVQQLWSIQRLTGTAAVTSVVAGDTPDGFTQVVALAATPSNTAELNFVVQLGKEEEEIQFRIQDIRVGEVDPAWFGNHYRVSLDQFNKENAKNCRA